jgi:hypothetical protein
MGALVVEAKTDREFQIIDGQQRLATLSILALAVIDRLGKIATGGKDPEANRERASSLRTRFIGEKDPASFGRKQQIISQRNRQCPLPRLLSATPCPAEPDTITKIEPLAVGMLSVFF